jgi:hypothetical protein
MCSGSHQKHAGIEDKFGYLVGFNMLCEFGFVFHHLLLVSDVRFY